MSNISKNLLVKGAKGKVGDQFVYKTRGKKTFITSLPTINPNTVATEEQVRVRELFGEASLFAKGAITNPELKAAYQQKKGAGQTAYNIAFRDFIKAPEVKLIDVSAYTGLAGSPIVVTAKDDFRVASVKVSILSAAGELIEEGLAILNPINRNKWIYSTVRENASLNGCIIRAIAKDIPENTGSLELVMP